MENDSPAFRALTFDQSSTGELSQKKIQATWKNPAPEMLVWFGQPRALSHTCH